MADDDQWIHAKRLLNDLLDADPDDPTAWLDARCGDDEALRTEVEGLYRAYRSGTLSAEDEALNYSRLTIAEAQAPLGRSLAAQGQFRRARPLLETSHAVLTADSTQNADAEARAHAEVGLGLYHVYRGQYARAESLLTAAHAALDTKYNKLKGVDENLMPVRRVERHLVDLYEAWGKPALAKKYRRTAGRTGDRLAADQ
jgi:tetratricopeptide (TPR) repeat protein